MQIPRVIADMPLDPVIEGLLAGKVEVLPWEAARSGGRMWRRFIRMGIRWWMGGCWIGCRE